MILYPWGRKFQNGLFYKYRGTQHSMYKLLFLVRVVSIVATLTLLAILLTFVCRSRKSPTLDTPPSGATLVLCSLDLNHDCCFHKVLAKTEIRQRAPI